MHGNLSCDIVFANLYKLCVNTVWYVLSIHLRNTTIASLNGHSFFKRLVSRHFLPGAALSRGVFQKVSRILHLRVSFDGGKWR